MKKLIYYLRYLTIFLIIELMLSFIISLINLIGIKSGVSSLMIFASNIILFLVLNYHNAKYKKKKGYLEGFLLGGLYIIFLMLVKVIIYRSQFTLTTIIYYSILIVISMFGGMIGVNKKATN